MLRLFLCGSMVSAVVAISAHAADDAKPFGLNERTPWTTSNFRGRPEPPPPFRPVPVFSKLKFDKTTVLAVEPISNRFFVAERAGKVYVLPEDRAAAEADVFLDAATLVDRLNGPGKPDIVFEALYGMTFDPDFAVNRYCYACYVVRARDRTAPQLPDGTRVVRFRVTDTEPPRCDVDTETLIISWLQGGHNGGCIKFGPDGNLYISSGDGGVAFPPDGLNSGQDLSRLLSKVMRIDVRREENGKPYSIPADNPFVNTPGARGETWSYGMRNPWKMSFDRKTGDLWVGDVGWELWELVYRVRKGDNYGWSIVEGSQPVHTERERGPTPIVPPIMEIPHTEGASVTGGFVYRGKQFPQLYGHYIFGDWETRRMWGVPVEGVKLTEAQAASIKREGDEIGERYEIIDPLVRIVDFAEDRDGEVYMLDHDDGTIYAFAPNVPTTETTPFPRKLSETGLFRSAAAQEPAPGVLPFSINVEQWSDHAIGERWIGVPGSETIRLHAKAKPVVGSQFSRATDYPTDTVLVKTLSLEMVHGDPRSRRRIETQTLHYDGREWLGYTYAWNDDQTDAELVERNGKNVELEVLDESAPGGKRKQTWRFSSRHECLRCHNPWSEYALAFNIPQLNRDHDFGNGAVDNQLRTLKHIGVLTDVFEPIDPNDPYTKPEPPRTPAKLPRHAPTFDESFEVAKRARSYLHVNCSHCHRFNGGGSSYIYLQHDLPLADMKAVAVRPTQGTFGIHDAQLLAPGDPHRSVLYFRLAKTGPGHMPHLGAKIVDDRALAVVGDWIRQLPVRYDDAAKIDRLIALDEATTLAREAEENPRAAWQLAKRYATQQQRETPSAEDLARGTKETAKKSADAVPKREAERRALVDELLAAPTRGLLLADAVRQRRLPPAINELVMQSALASTVDPAIRDLFEAFVPEEMRTKRLGEVIDPVAILQLKGDAERGRRLFHESTVVQCRSCHRIGEKGIAIGPDLDWIGRKYKPAKLLESIMQPSLEVDPKYKVWVVETAAGSVYTGLLVSRDEQAVVLRDAQNKQHRIAVADVEGIFPQTKSLMPEMLLRDFTAEQLADLLAYLSTLQAEIPADETAAAAQ